MRMLIALLLGSLAFAVQAIEADRLVLDARQQVGVTLSYDPAYRRLSYPGGDVPVATGVCTDVVIRALRQQGLDLQEAVHRDMRGNFSVYPKNWGLSRPDSNIDHRRVPNLMTWFKRQGWSLPVKQDAARRRRTFCSPTASPAITARLPSGRALRNDQAIAAARSCRWRARGAVRRRLQAVQQLGEVSHSS